MPPFSPIRPCLARAMEQMPRDRAVRAIAVILAFETQDAAMLGHRCDADPERIDRILDDLAEVGMKLLDRRLAEEDAGDRLGTTERDDRFATE